MRGDTHMLIGFTTGAAVASHFHMQPSLELIAVLALATVAALVPDIDQPGSTIARRLPLIALLPFGRHRGFTHSLMALALVYLALVAIRADLVMTVAVIAGYASHILADSITVTGVQLLFPYPERIRLVPWFLAVGRTAENFVSVATLFVAIFLISGI